MTAATDATPSVPKIEATLLRVVLGFRVVALVWMAIKVIAALITDDALDSGVAVAALVVAALWTVVTVYIGRDRRRLMRSDFLAMDGIVALAIALAPFVADAEETFFGGYPISWLIIVTYAAGILWGLASALSLMASQILGSLIQDTSVTVTTVVGELTFVVVAAVFGWGIATLRRYDRMRIEARKALEEERQERIRLQDREEIAGHLHDSVLQSLALIQRRADDEEEVRYLARRQERDLRRWIHRMTSGYDNSFRAAILAAGEEIEDLHRIKVEAVAVGDCDLDDDLDALVQATREALINAAKYAGVDRISLYAEADDERVSVYVRDKGAGFDPSTVGADRRGISESIVGRLERVGGSAKIQSLPDEGTQVELIIDRT